MKAINEDPDQRPLIGVVGPCGSGKSSLISGLENEGFRCRHIAQEHSYVKDMWQRITHPDFLIYLHSSYEVSSFRRRLNWTEGEYDEQLRRLAHAHEHADLIIDTDLLTIQEVRQQVVNFLKSKPKKD